MGLVFHTWRPFGGMPLGGHRDSCRFVISPSSDIRLAYEGVPGRLSRRLHR